MILLYPLILQAHVHSHKDRGGGDQVFLKPPQFLERWQPHAKYENPFNILYKHCEGFDTIHDSLKEVSQTVARAAHDPFPNPGLEKMYIFHEGGPIFCNIFGYKRAQFPFNCSHLPPNAPDGTSHLSKFSTP